MKGATFQGFNWTIISVQMPNETKACYSIQRGFNKTLTEQTIQTALWKTRPVLQFKHCGRKTRRQNDTPLKPVRSPEREMTSKPILTHLFKIHLHF